jgi:drug/metabolite transporter (DMT)-like permease
MSALWRSGPALLALCMLFWAANTVLGRAAAPLIPPALFTAIRWAGALTLTIPFAWHHLRRDWPALRARWWLPVILGLLGTVVYNSLVYRGLHDTTAVNALLLASSSPLLVLVVALILFGDRPRRMEVVAIFTSLAGVVVIAAQGSLETLRQLRINPGDAQVLLAMVSFAVYSAMLRLKPAVHPMSLLATSIAAGTVVLVPLAWWEHAAGGRLVVTEFSIGALAFAAIFPAFLSYVFFNRGVELVGAARAGQYMHLMPAFGIVLAVLFLGERLHPYHAAGVVLIGTGLWLADRAGHPAKPDVRRPLPRA